MKQQALPVTEETPFAPQPAAAEAPAADSMAAMPPLSTDSAKLLDEAVAATMAGDESIRSLLAEIRVKSAYLDFNNRLARMFVASGLFDDLKNCAPAAAVARALLKIELGRSYGLEPAMAMQYVYIVLGVPTIKAELLAARMRQAGYNWVVKRHDDTACVLMPTKDGKHIMVSGKDDKLVPAEVSFTIEDAKRAKLIKKDGAWETVPRNMLFWRCISNLKRFFAPEVGIPLPTTEEMQHDNSPIAEARPNLPIGNRPDGAVVTDRVA